METKSLLKSNDKIIFSANLNGIITDWSLTAQELFGYKKEEIIVTSISSTSKNIFSELLKIKENIIKGESTQSFTSKRMLQDGTLVEIVFSFALNNFHARNEQKVDCLLEKILPVNVKNTNTSRSYSKTKIKSAKYPPQTK